ncbi:MAG: hypothetical protein AAF467_25485 [Actinomycetota bacterium]
MDDVEFDERMRNAVTGIADGAPPPHPFPAPTGGADQGDGLGRRRRVMDHRSRLALVAAAVAVLLTGGWLAASAGLFDQSVDIAATDEGAGMSSAVAPNPGRSQEWPTVTPGADLIPLGALEPRRVIFGPGDEAATAAADYLADRLPDLAATPDGLVIEEVETVDGHAVFSWSYDIADVSTTGWVYLLEAEGSWWVVAAVSDGVDARRVAYDLRRVTGLITATGDNALVVDLVDIDTGEPFQPATGDTVDPGPSGRQLGTAGRSERLDGEETIDIDTPVAREQFAIRIQAVGGTALTITEFTVSAETAETVLILFVEPAAINAVVAALAADDRTGDYQRHDAAETRVDEQRLVSAAPELAEIWDAGSELESVSLALATTDPIAAVIEELRLLEGVVAVVPAPSPSPPDDEEAATPARGECPTTQPPEEAFVPPAPWPATPASDNMAWYGTDELWTVIEIDWPIENKSVWWSAQFPGGPDEPNPPLTVIFERLDADLPPIVYDAPGTNAFTDADQWFMINGREPTESGCWQATATYRGTTLSYIFEVP